MFKYFIILVLLMSFTACNKKNEEKHSSTASTPLSNHTKTVTDRNKKEKETVKHKPVKHKPVRRTNLFKEFKAPEFALKNTTGDIVKLSDYKGKVVLVDFWGTWCPPCRRMIPVLSSFVNKCGKEGVVLIGIHSSGNSPGPAAIDDFAGKVGVNYPMLLGTKEVENAYGVKGFPSLFLIGRDGQVKHKFVGVHALDEIRKYVRVEIDKK